MRTLGSPEGRQVRDELIRSLQDIRNRQRSKTSSERELKCEQQAPRKSWRLDLEHSGS